MKLLPAIIFENENFLVIDKPSGLVVHPFDYSKEETLLDFLQDKNPSIFLIENKRKLGDGRIISLGGLVHKLDRDTSGIMVIAKNEKTFTSLKKQFTEHTIGKTYLALVEGVVKETTFRIDGPLGRNKKEYKQSVNPSNPRGELREAVTDVSVIKRNAASTLVELSPKTGRTHQLRAHLSYVGHPIVGDKAYGGTIESRRIMLHAKRLMFTLFGEECVFEVKTPEGFE